MLFLGDIPAGMYEYFIVMAVAIITVIVSTVLGLKYLKKSGVIQNRSYRNTIYSCGCVLIFLTIIYFMFIIPSVAGGEWHTRYLNSLIAALWALGIFIAVYIVLIYLIRSKKKILEEVEEERENNKI
jgi:Kef-type K+ transport system membrane component KefB